MQSEDQPKEQRKNRGGALVYLIVLAALISGIVAVVAWLSVQGRTEAAKMILEATIPSLVTAIVLRPREREG